MGGDLIEGHRCRRPRRTWRDGADDSRLQNFFQGHVATLPHPLFAVRYPSRRYTNQRLRRLSRVFDKHFLVRATLIQYFQLS